MDQPVRFPVPILQIHIRELLLKVYLQILYLLAKESLPHHVTQQILIDNEDELQIKLTLYITHDLVREPLSFGDNMKALKSGKLIN